MLTGMLCVASPRPVVRECSTHLTPNNTHIQWLEAQEMHALYKAFTHTAHTPVRHEPDLSGC
jgi:hypothetical protein